MKKLIKLAFVFFAAFLTLIAQINAVSACSFLWYQPELPNSLKK
ncbi:hypothetical protein H0A61_01551 [Koleobacter methoxysyntrophicus]|uniref:Cyclic lactone autoinducer peptide n=1 Tax=Koleobacter methoxysyntrophicus TaxID=2751313 RepID=A0A8A0RMT2_9FIRM|nr:cyclic lactone autoinducer peptide [Koleobacter methoxysyntrophicus]QSQ09192.1 hypothetical protein H0A61_01551 [Koleobacter methoxysyntrophicus]